jgi:murein DD-endopeptidase MepM/ murein hydrolase activator NlpD
LPLYRYPLDDPDYLARRRARELRRRLHVVLLLLAAFCALVIVPLRGAAHIGPHHAVAAYAPPQPLPSATPAQAGATAAPAGQDAAYFRAPVAIDGVNQAKTGGGLAIQGSGALAANAASAPGVGAQGTPRPAGTPTAIVPATPTATPNPDAPAIEGDVPENPNAAVLAAAADSSDSGSTAAAGATPGNTAPAAAPAGGLSKPLFFDHVVKPGDTVSVIAARYGITESTIVENNPLISNKNALFVGQSLRIPTKDGILYDVHLGDTVADIADTYSVEPQAVVSLAANGLADANQIREGQTILVVGAKAPTPPPTPSPTPSPSPAPTAAPTTAPAAPAPAAAPPAAAPAAAPKPAQPATPSVPISASGFIWPAHGPITQGFGLTDFAEGGAYGGSGHPGVDIGQSYGLPIVASKDGVVSFAGGDPCCGYGYYVDINHGNGLSTRYGHMRAWPSVSIGQRVTQGQIIGYSGSTGYSTGPHVHFEFDINGIPVNPFNYLPPTGN